MDEIMNGTDERLQIKNDSLGSSNYFLSYEGVAKICQNINEFLYLPKATMPPLYILKDGSGTILSISNKLTLEDRHEARRWPCADTGCRD